MLAGQALYIWEMGNFSFQPVQRGGGCPIPFLSSLVSQSSVFLWASYLRPEEYNVVFLWPTLPGFNSPDLILLQKVPGTPFLHRTPYLGFSFPFLA